MQIDLLVNSFVNDMARVATLQYTKSVGQVRMSWLDISDGHHGLSHEPDTDEAARQKLIKINHWLAGEVRYLAPERMSNQLRTNHPVRRCNPDPSARSRGFCR